MGKLAKKLREQRVMKVEAGGFTFIARRPTDLEMMRLNGANGEQVMQFVTGWENVRQSDIVDGGDPHPAEFDAEDAREWLSDRPDLFKAILQGLMAGYEAHAKALEARLKNSDPGSSNPPSALDQVSDQAP